MKDSHRVLPGLPVAAPRGAEGPVHRRDLVSVEPHQVVVLEQLEADGHPVERHHVVLDRHGRLVERRSAEGLEPMADPGLPLPATFDGWRISTRTDGDAVIVELVAAADSSEPVRLTRLPRARALELGGLHLSAGSPPQLAALTWTAREDGTTVSGVEVLDLGRARARLKVREGLVPHRAGDYAEAARLFAEAMEIDPELSDAVYDLACALARLGEHDRAFTYLGNALDLDPRRLRVAAASDSDLDSLRGDPRFAQLLATDD